MFWNTMKGQQLAEILIRELPKLTKGKEQYIETMKPCNVHRFLNERIKAGDRYVGQHTYDGLTTIIMEKK